MENGKRVARTIGVVASVVGCSGRNISEWLSRGCPGEHGHYVLPDIIEWAKSSVWSKPETSSGDPLLDDADGSPALEEYRRAKAALARLELAEKEKRLVRVEDVIDPLMEGASVVRAAGERIGRLYGPEAQAIVNEAVEEFVAGLNRIGGDE